MAMQAVRPNARAGVKGVGLKCIGPTLRTTKLKIKICAKTLNPEPETLDRNLQ